MIICRRLKLIFVTVVLPVLFLAGGASAVNLGETKVFNVDKNFDAAARTQITAILVKTTNNLYFYIEKSWWDSQPQAKQAEVLADLDNLSSEFDNKIYREQNKRK